MTAVPVAFRLAVPPRIAGGIAGVRLSRPVAPGGEDVAGRFAAKLVEMPGKTGLISCPATDWMNIVTRATPKKETVFIV